MARGFARGGSTAPTVAKSGSAPRSGGVPTNSGLARQGGSSGIARQGTPQTGPKQGPPATPTHTPEPSSNSTLGTTPTGTYSGVSYTNPVEDPLVTAQAAEPVVKKPSLTDYLAGDETYNAQLTALKSALQQFGADVGYVKGGTWNDKKGMMEGGEWVNGLQGNTYNKDYDRNLKDLGWDATTKGWNPNDRLTSYGSSYNNQLEDYAARGMFDSTAYNQAKGNLERGFQDQYNSMDSAKQTFLADLLNQYNSAYADSEVGKNQAKIDATARRTAEYS